jgi:PTS system mannose-specific IID component
MADKALKEGSILTKKDLLKSWFTWININCLSNNWERMQNVPYTLMIAPILKKLYPKDKEKFNQRLTSHMEFYNTQPTFGCVVNGIVVAMEEEKAAGKDIPDEAISSVKTSMMGPLAGIGDTVMNGLLNVILLSIAMNLAMQGNVLGPILFAVTWVPISLGFSWLLTKRGYMLGVNSLSILSPQAMGRIVDIMTITGMVVIGGLSATYVSLSTPLVMSGVGGAKDVVVQELLNGILPGLLPLLLVVVSYFLMAKKKLSALKLILIIFVVGTALSLLGIL